MKLLLSILFLIPFTSVYELHEFHLSKCIIEYSEEDQALQITIHLFIDDLEEALRQQGADKLFLCTEKESENAETHILNYLQQTFQLLVDGKELNYAWIGKEASDDLQAIWCYLEIPNMNQLSELTVTNNTLMDVFDDQKNLVNVIGPNKVESYFIFEKGDSKESIQY